MNNNEQLEIKQDLYPVKDWPFSYPSPGGLRSLIFQAEKNGFDKVIRRVGPRKILLSVSAFQEWVELQNAKNR